MAQKVGLSAYRFEMKGRHDRAGYWQFARNSETDGFAELNAYFKSRNKQLKRLGDPNDDGEDSNVIATSLSQIDDVAGILSVELLPLNKQAETAAERTASMEAALDAREDFVLPIDPDVHMLRTTEVGTFLTNGPRTPIGTTVGGNPSNSLAREIPPLLITDSQGEIPMTIAGVTITDDDDYLYGHLDLPYGCVQAIPLSIKSYNGDALGWQAFSHAGYRTEFMYTVTDWYENIFPTIAPSLESDACFLKGIDRHD